MQSVVLQQLGTYFDIGATFYEPPRGDWAGMVISEWEALFLPLRHAPGSATHPHHHLVLPISGTLHYVRR